MIAIVNFLLFSSFYKYSIDDSIPYSSFYYFINNIKYSLFINKHFYFYLSNY